MKSRASSFREYRDDQVAGGIDRRDLAGMEDCGGAHLLDDRRAGDAGTETKTGALVDRGVEPAGLGIEVDGTAAGLRLTPYPIRHWRGQRRLRHRTDDLEPQIDDLDRPTGDVVAVHLGVRGAETAGEFPIDGAALSRHIETIQTNRHLENPALIPPIH